MAYSNSCRIGTNGFSGGIWVLWSDNVIVNILGLLSQVVHMRISNGQSSSGFLYSAVNANTHRTTRCLLWDYLNSVANSIDEPWLIAGDFSSILDMFDRIGCAATFRNGCAYFKEFLFTNGLLDLDCCMSHFT
ncbi:Pyridoxal-phosphate-dependent serine hydroxymethyltransferase [Gossypium arboreum]|uniref:Pyridoxal-phosphate-dependent serine hydroxymethyltransferase n=1 Tax=Gossypium arboreum TaxID=29729 RepID=A0A0B0PTM3_GOSAR|nr:Pyridoxal-phosphate-dependent serine hydroxymethyltransferase [Gossypium arboreum]